MSSDRRPPYVALVAALREEFNGLNLEALWIQMRDHRYDITSREVLAAAVHDARDINYDTKAATAEVDQMRTTLHEIAAYAEERAAAAEEVGDLFEASLTPIAMRAALAIGATR